ncbi:MULTISPECIES: gluconokinase [Micromonospora]|uniref:Gluconokinase n=1 Tax=Micromonospora sicca TaxID=2202420 RepID=A0A317CW88_9ACTN|nr:MULTISPECIES: gluconokinase [unclassified Micromonospora]MBM0229103.1 gluconokinase [Micromonospora sp. ATA51]MDZ5444921.1 gluconokinase [Micromonospora sp. 4G57]MDZ5487919.1 gluconokinase [Micromonospora sp. 4G53]PWR06657.1 gluconate kinase [Micromonospora sp. 4G51]
MTGDRPLTRHVVVMGVSGAGKTTVARGISELTGLRFAEADEFHSEANVARMRSGVPLDDADRWPWLRDLAAWMATRHAEGVSTVLACSALKRSYRDVLRQGPPNVEFVHLAGAAELIRDRMSRRADHYMPASLLDSQRAILEPLAPEEAGVVLDVALVPDELAAAAVARLGLPAGIPVSGR